MRVPSRLLTCLLLCSASAFAQSTAPGLWEMRNKMGGNPEMDKAMAEMKKQLASMPPAQRKQMEAMMGQRGLSVGAEGMSMKVCITPEMAARSEMPRQSKGECTTTVLSRTSNSVKSRFECKNPPSSGEGTYTFNGDKSYTMHMVIQSVHDGQPVTTTMDGQGKWLSNDCGNIKPIPMPVKQ